MNILFDSKNFKVQTKEISCQNFQAQHGILQQNLSKASTSFLDLGMDDVANINRATLQGIVDKSHLSLQQKNMVWEIRRKNKNRLAAAKCRKRKLEIITNKSYTREELRQGVYVCLYFQLQST